MKSYYPRFRRGAAPGLVAKLGGLPWGLPARLWPVCRECKRPMTLLAQLPADPPILPLGHDDEVLFIFKCEWDSVCFAWEVDGGANAVFTVPRGNLGNAPTAAPAATVEVEPAVGFIKDGVNILTPMSATRVLTEFGLTRWIEADDGAPAELEDAFYDYDRHNALPDDVKYPHEWDSDLLTKAGGVPYWTPNGVMAQPELPAGRLLLQIDTSPTLEDGSEVTEEEFANFASDGTAYVFVDRTQTPPRYAMFINR